MIEDPAFVSVGITGGIASGKSTVARMFVALGGTCIDADAIAREVVAPGSPVLEAVRQRFGPGVVRSDGTLDRAALAERVFASAEERRSLNAITHPAIVAEIKQRLARERELANQAARPGAPRRVAVAEIPLLVEEGLQSLVDRIIVVFAKQSTQVARLLDGKGLTEEQAWARVRAQLPLDEKLPFADWVIDGEAPLPEVESRVHRIWSVLTRAPRPSCSIP
jgi:dephospho-CoA kinase